MVRHDESYYDDKPAHKVKITKPFYIGVYEVTQAQYEKIMGKNLWGFKGPDRPVDNVSWNDAVLFCKKLSEKEGVNYRLPTEAEWEYACRAGTTTRYYWGDDPTYTAGDDYAWWQHNAWAVDENYAHVVGLKTANAFGLHDMSGNVWEWCQDWYHLSYTGAPADGSAWESPSGSQRVLRGGCWSFYAYECRSAHRGRFGPGVAGYGIGFRIAR